MNSHVVGIDIGGSHITVAMVDMEKRKIIQEGFCREMVDSTGSADEIIDSWTMAIEKCLGDRNRQDVYIGIAMPGPFDYTNGICYIKEQKKFNALYGMNLGEALAENLSIKPDQIQFVNDAACFLRGEVFGGAAQHFQNVMGFTLGTGFGSALHKDGETADANLWSAPFRKGIAEDYFSTRWFVDRYNKHNQHKVNNVQELASLYQSNDEVKEIFNEFGQNLAEFLDKIIQEQGSEVVVFGGNISKCFNYFSPSLKTALKQNGNTFQVRQSVLNENASLIGAASCWLKEAEV